LSIVNLALCSVDDRFPTFPVVCVDPAIPVSPSSISFLFLVPPQPSQAICSSSDTYNTTLSPNSRARQLEISWNRCHSPFLLCGFRCELKTDRHRGSHASLIRTLFLGSRPQGDISWGSRSWGKYLAWWAVGSARAVARFGFIISCLVSLSNEAVQDMKVVYRNPSWTQQNNRGGAIDYRYELARSNTTNGGIITKFMPT